MLAELAHAQVVERGVTQVVSLPDGVSLYGDADAAAGDSGGVLRGYRFDACFQL